MSKTRRAAFHTLGCKTNQYETDALRLQFQRAGFELVAFTEEADVYVLNTCTVTGEADRKSRQLLRRARSRNPQAILVALGCAIELGLDEPAVDIQLGTRNKAAALARVQEKLNNPGWEPGAASLLDTAADEQQDDEQQDYEEFGPVDQQSETRAFIKVEDGCNHACTYCAIPLARGPVRSRQPDEVIAEARALVKAGYREVILTGIHICSYGQDWQKPSVNLMELALQLAEIDGLTRIRLGSLEPRAITSDWIRLARENSKLCPHFHLSLQSGSDTVLRRMNRRYRTNEFRQVVTQLRAGFTMPAITTDMIVGFPGETEEEHQESLDFCRSIGFSRMHIFRFSPRAGTAAARMSDPVSAEVSLLRSRDMANLAQAGMLASHREQVGRRQQVIIEKELEAQVYSGYTERYMPAMVSAGSALAPGSVAEVMAKKADQQYIYCTDAI